MYGVVLMMALSGGADAPAMNAAYAEPAAKYGDHGHKEYRLFGGRRGGHGCCGGGGCYGGGYGGCHGGSYGGCYGGGYGGGCHGGGCYGGGYGGCHGGAYGGGYGGCCGGGGYGAYGSGDGGYYGAMPYEGGYGNSSWSTPISYGSSGLPILQSGYQYGLPFDAADRGYYDNNSNAAATIVVHLPAGATLTVDDSSTRSTGSVRTFLSPPLQADKEFTYTLRAVETRDGKKVERKRDVKVRAGQTSEVTIDFAERLPAPGQ